MDRLLEAVEAATSRLAVERRRLLVAKARSRLAGPATIRPTGSSASSKAFGFSAIRHLANAAHLRRFAREAKSMHQPDVLVVSPIAQWRCNSSRHT